jgi:hypothetical protein
MLDTTHVATSAISTSVFITTPEEYEEELKGENCDVK